MAIENILDWLCSLAIQYGYLGIFFVSLIGAMAVFIPIPYTVVLFTLASLRVDGNWVFNPLLIGVIGATGAAVGELSGYLIGAGGRKVISEKYKKRMDLVMKLFQKYGTIVIFFFAMLPIPDDLLFIPLGMMRYGIVRAIIPAVIAKVISHTVIAYGGRLAIDIIIKIFGVDGIGVTALIGASLSITIFIIIFILLFKVNWEDRLQKYLEPQEKNEKPTNNQSKP